MHTVKQIAALSTDWSWAKLEISRPMNTKLQQSRREQMEAMKEKVSDETEIVL